MVSDASRPATAAAARGSPPTAASYHGVVREKMPLFRGDKLETWFGQLEAAFVRMGIRDSRLKYGLAVGELPVADVTESLGLMMQAATDSADPYADLKEELRWIYTLNRSARLEELLYGKELGDWSPDQLVRRMEALLSQGTPRKCYSRS